MRLRLQGVHLIRAWEHSKGDTHLPEDTQHSIRQQSSPSLLRQVQITYGSRNNIKNEATERMGDRGSAVVKVLCYK